MKFERNTVKKAFLFFGGTFVGLLVTGSLALKAMGATNPVTDFFFSNTITQSYPVNEGWSQGTLDHAERTVSDTLVLAGRTTLLTQPIESGTWTSYNFNQPTSIPAVSSP